MNLTDLLDLLNDVFQRGGGGTSGGRDGDVEAQAHGTTPPRGFEPHDPMDYRDRNPMIGPEAEAMRAAGSSYREGTGAQLLQLLEAPPLAGPSRAVAAMITGEDPIRAFAQGDSSRSPETFQTLVDRGMNPLLAFAIEAAIPDMVMGPADTAGDMLALAALGPRLLRGASARTISNLPQTSQAALNALPPTLRDNPSLLARLDANANTPNFDPKVWRRPGMENPRTAHLIDPDTNRTDPSLLTPTQRARYQAAMADIQKKYPRLRDAARIGQEAAPADWYMAQQHLDEAITAVGDANVGRALFDQVNVHSAFFSPRSAPLQEVARAVYAWNYAVRTGNLSDLMEQAMWPSGLGHKANKVHIPAAERLMLGELAWDPLTGANTPFGSAAIKTDNYQWARVGNPANATIDTHADSFRRLDGADLDAVMNPPPQMTAWNARYAEGRTAGAENFGHEGWLLHEYAMKYAGARPKYQLADPGVVPGLGSGEAQAGRDLFNMLGEDLGVAPSPAQGMAWHAARDVTGVRDSAPITDVISEVFAREFGAFTSEQRVQVWRDLMQGNAIRNPMNITYSKKEGMQIAPALMLAPILLPAMAIALDEWRDMYGEDFLTTGYLEVLNAESALDPQAGETY